MRPTHRHIATLAGLSVALTTVAGCLNTESFDASDATDFPRRTNSLLPPAPSPFADSGVEWHLGAGEVTGTGPEQPIAFPHYTHVMQNGMQCEYCHQAARKSIHGGVPQTATCMNCHSYVAKDKPAVKKLVEYWESGEPIPWKKVHDLPDFVHFSHKRHVQGGVDCTECHGQMGLQGEHLVGWEPPASSDDHHEGDGHESDAAHAKAEGPVTVIRETTMQMGWCLDCHATHESIDINYGDKANLRRAELKDCWTCHK
jgi:hypothetical protein